MALWCSKRLEGIIEGWRPAAMNGTHYGISVQQIAVPAAVAMDQRVAGVPLRLGDPAEHSVSSWIRSDRRKVICSSEEVSKGIRVWPDKKSSAF